MVARHLAVAFTDEAGVRGSKRVLDYIRVIGEFNGERV